MTDQTILGVIGGSGLYSMDGLEDVRTLEVDTPFGKPSSAIVVGSFSSKNVAFLARHGIGHHISPTEVNYRANIYALKSIGVDQIVSISACGSLREDYAPGEIVIPDQIFDFTRDRARSFFGNGMVVHISSADPFCPDLSNQVYQAVVETGAVVHRGGTLITIEGPRFSTKAESHLYRSWGMSIIGMTACPEAFLAREAGICYCIMAHVTDYDVWHSTEEPVSVEIVVRTLMQNTATAQDAIRNLSKEIKPERNCTCAAALENAIITQPDVIPDETRNKVSLLIPKNG